MRDAIDNAANVFLHCGIRHVQAGASPYGVVGFSFGVFDKPILLIFEMRIIVSPGEGHEPDAGDKAETRDAFLRFSHAAGVGAFGRVGGEIFLRAVELLSVLPLVVDEDEIETEWLQLLRCDRRDLWQMHFVTGTGVFLHIPSAEARLLARQLDGIDFGNRVRIGFHAEAGIVEPSHRKGFGLGIRTRLDPQTAIVDLRLHPHRAIFHR